MKNARGTVLRAGDESLGGKRNFSPYGASLVGSSRRSTSGEHELIVTDVVGKKGRASLVRTPLWLHAAFTGPQP